MRLYSLLLISHVSTCAIGGIAAAVAVGGLETTSARVATGLVAAIVVVLGAVVVASRFRQGLRSMVQAVAKGKQQPQSRTGIADFDTAASSLAEYSQRWSEAATNAREQARDLEDLLFQLDRRTGRDGAAKNAAAQLRTLMAGIADTVDGELNQLVHGADEITRSVQLIADGTDEQSDAVSKTTTYVEQISADIDAVVRDSAGAQQSVAAVRSVAVEAAGLVDELKRSLERLRSRLETNERRLRALGDHSREIGAIVKTISTIASRTDLLALNAAIESVRAGEQGRGFAIVAEEVHRLAEQSGQATREVAALLESTQLEAQESIHGAVEDQDELGQEMHRAKSAQESIEKMLRLLDDSSGRVDEISHAAEHQLLMTQDVVLAVERIAQVAKTTRSSAEKARWTTKSLAKITQKFDSVLTPLRRSGDRTLRAAPEAGGSELVEHDNRDFDDGLADRDGLQLAEAGTVPVT